MSYNETVWREDFAQVLLARPQNSGVVSQGVAGARLCVFSCSIALLCFYTFQWRIGRCNLHPIYVQFVTFCVYILSCFGTTDFLYIPVVDHAGVTFDLAIGRYLFWMMTCPVIISNVNILLNIMTPDDIELPQVTFMMVKDIVMIAFGVLAAMQQNITLKWIFNLASYFVCFWLVADLIVLMNEKKKFFMVYERCWEWIFAVMIYFFCAQSLFIFLYAVGPPCFNIMGPDGDRIGHSVGDLFAKNLFGFFAWYVRFVVLDPHVKRIRGARAVSPYQTRPVTATDQTSNRVSFLGRKTNTKKTTAGPRPPRLLIVEPKIELQRLFMFILRDAGIEGEIAFDLESATKIIRRDSLTHYDAILLNLTVAFEQRIATQKFRMQFRRKPFYLPLLGYCFDDNYAPLAEREEVERNLSDGFVRHVLDEAHLFDVVSHWREASGHWREIDDSADMERRLHQHVQGVHLSPVEGHGDIGSMSLVDTKYRAADEQPHTTNSGNSNNSREREPRTAMMVESPTSPGSPSDTRSVSGQAPQQQKSGGARISLRRKSSFETMNDNLRHQLKVEEEQVARLKQQGQDRQQVQSPVTAGDDYQQQSSGRGYYEPPSSIDSQAEPPSGRSATNSAAGKDDDLADEELGPKRRTSLIVKGSMM
ncbi:Hypothetical Protein FCC1311_007872 [Hondaea fermentalgiana]|uniref:Uncharacterized protein n=1 Tax=Hondaea fermentalgiana TaxID=2315210 RepID=A0A2R5G461_9STRA|nr:Hypothetical Protein FCC1311_007872 [Hondaea fermentalgiana]|eukprot:GBG24568.1 Hypothetical Protein FCC1311_007872 [Hondaea fermentalgiana]